MKELYKDENLDYFDFSNSCLIGIKFENCSLRFCTFTDSDLSYTVFEACDLYCADFSGTVLYTTRFNSCDATKADFEYGILNGIRVRDTVVTHAKFGFRFKTGMERKPIKNLPNNDEFLECDLGILPDKISRIEATHKGIFCKRTNRIISFIEPDDEKWRIWRRKSEIAKNIKNLLEENGYKDQSTEYYFHQRQFTRRSNQKTLERNLDYFFGELFWGYGVKIWHPVISFFLTSFSFSIIYSLLPLFDPFSGVINADLIISIFPCDGMFSVDNYLQILYSSILISTLSVFGDIDVGGYAKPFAIVHVLTSVLSLGLGIASLTKKMANV